VLRATLKSIENPNTKPHLNSAFRGSSEKTGKNKEGKSVLGHGIEGDEECAGQQVDAAEKRVNSTGSFLA
jgi:hypothetical protein